MTPAQLRAFAAIVRLGSAKEAAAELGVSEAAISSHTAALRKELDDQLYRRAGSGLCFTPGGLRLATRAIELLGLQDQTKQEVMAAGSGHRILRLAATSLFAEYAAPGLIELFKTRADDLEVELSVHPGADLDSLLLSRSADVTVCSRPEATDVRLQSRAFLKYQLVVVVAAGHPLANLRCHPQTLAKQPWLLGPSAADPNEQTATLLSRFAVPPENQRIFQSHAAAMAETLDGRGVGAMPEFRAQSALQAGRLCRVSTVGGAIAGIWTATRLAPTGTPAVADELIRFITTPRAIQAMLTGSGANVGRFRPSVHVTLWS